MSTSINFNFNFGGDLAHQDPVAAGQWAHSVVSSFNTAQEGATQSSRPVSSEVTPTDPTAVWLSELTPPARRSLDDTALDVINRWQVYDRNNSRARLQLMDAILNIPCHLQAPRARSGEPSKRPYLNITPNLEGTAAEYAGSLNSGRVIFTNARHLVDVDNPLVDNSGAYPTVELFKSEGAHDFVIDVLTRYFEECFQPWLAKTVLAASTRTGTSN